MGTSYTRYKEGGFWTRDAALETTLTLMVAELQTLAEDDSGLDRALDAWTLQAIAGFNGCVSPDLDHHLADARLAGLMPTALHNIQEGLRGRDGLVEANVGDLRERIERITDGEPWRMPSALAGWVREVVVALTDLVEGRLAETPGGAWFVSDDGRSVLPTRGT